MATSTKSKKTSTKRTPKGRLPSGVGYRTYNRDGSVRTSEASGTHSANIRAEIDAGTDTERGESGTIDRSLTPRTITSTNLDPVTGINLPPPPAPSNLGTTTMTGMAGLGAPTTTTTTPVDTAPETAFQKYLNSIKENKAPDTESIYKKTEREAGLREAQELKNTYQNQLNAITAKASADKLSLVGQGRGVTDVIIGGQQAQIDREAAIQALPIAAQLSAAQNDLQAAQDHVDTYFKIRLEDAQNKYEQKNKISEAVYNFATTQQKAALDAKNKLDDRAYDRERDNLASMERYAIAAINNGQPSLAASIMKVDPKSDSFAEKISTYAGSIQVAQKSSGGGSGGGTLEERQAAALADVNSKIVPGAMTPSGLTILNPDGNYINPAAWKDMISHAPEIGLNRSSFIANFGNQLYIEGGKPSANYGLTPKEIKDLGYE